jgi:hypothetical protein
MTIVRPILKITHFADLQHGDFFIYEHAHGRSVALKVRDPRMDYPDLALPLGPDFPADRAGPHLYQAPRATVISFGKNVLVRLPPEPRGWTTSPPPLSCSCILSIGGSSASSPPTCYFRANCQQVSDASGECYIDVFDGTIFTSGSGVGMAFAKPTGAMAFATEWELFTSEDEPWLILDYQWQP